MSELLETLQNEIKSKCTKCVLSLSGGLDSTTLAYLLVNTLGKDNVAAVSFNYNQRHDIELQKAKKTVEKLGIKYELIDISHISKIVEHKSAMVKGPIETPTLQNVLGQPQPSTYFPYRNMLLFTYCCVYGESIDFDGIALGVQKIDSYMYWDTTLDFVGAMKQAIDLNRKANMSIVTPFVEMDKVKEIQLGQELGVDYSDTWTCYNPQTENDKIVCCGICPSCCERKAAFQKVGIVDPLPYK